MNDDGTDLEVFQQCRDLVFGDWTSAATFVPLHIRATAGLQTPYPCRTIVPQAIHHVVQLSSHGHFVLYYLKQRPVWAAD
jgi:hypothetical protein